MISECRAYRIVNRASSGPRRDDVTFPNVGVKSGTASRAARPYRRGDATFPNVGEILIA
jgi:hypothetical protein